jgi:hypothetical protein
MNKLDNSVPVRGGRMRIPRSRGATSGFLLILLGLWGALIPFIGPYFDFAYTPDEVWTWTPARGWLEVLPAAAMLGAWLAVIAGLWYVVGGTFGTLLHLGDIGTPVATTEFKRAMLEIAFFYGLGSVIAVLGALAAGRLSVRSLRDIQYAHRPVATTEPAAVSEAPTEQMAPPRHAVPATEPVAPIAQQEPRHRGFGGLFRRDHETTTTGR